MSAPSGAEELKKYKDVIKIIKMHKGSYSILDYEGFYIAYPNSLTFVKGTLLKQEALIAKNKFELEKLKFERGDNDQKDLSKAEKAYIAARNKFCNFLKEAEYVD